MNGIRTVLAAAVFAALAAPAGAAVGDGTFDAFQSVCGDTHGDWPAIAAAAGAASWKPSDVQGSTMAGVTVTDRLSRTAIADGHEITLVATHGKTAPGASAPNGLSVTTCTVYGQKEGLAELQARAAKWLGFPPHDTSGQEMKYHLTYAGGAYKAVADADVDAAAGGDGMDLLTVKADAGKSIVDFVKIKK